MTEPDLTTNSVRPELGEGPPSSCAVEALRFDPANPLEGDYAIVEVLGHRRYAGRVSEVQRFGTAFLQIEPLFQNWLLPPILVGTSSIYQFTACNAATAWDRRAKNAFDLQVGIAAIPAVLDGARVDQILAVAEEQSDG